MEWLATFMWTVIAAIVVGAVFGTIARLIVPGKQKMSVAATVVVGFVGALLGGLLAEGIGVADTDGIDWIKFAIQVGLAAVGVAFYSGWIFKR